MRMAELWIRLTLCETGSSLILSDVKVDMTNVVLPYEYLAIRRCISNWTNKWILHYNINTPNYIGSATYPWINSLYHYEPLIPLSKINGSIFIAMIQAGGRSLVKHVSLEDKQK